MHLNAEVGPDGALPLLILCASVSASPEIDHQIRAWLDRQPDWDRVFLLADLHAVLPLVRRRLLAKHRDLVPAAVLDRLESRFRTNSGRNLVLAHELGQLVDRFKERGIPVLTFKGLVMAQAAYGQINLRSFLDLDLLVREEHVDAAMALLAASGYENDCHWNAAQHACHRRTEYHYRLTDPERKLCVELHWDFFGSALAMPLDLDAIWRNAQPVTLMEHALLAPSREDSLLIACLHGAKHLWRRLEWIAAVAGILSNTRDWNGESLLERARGLGYERMVRLGLCLANDLLDAPLPAAFQTGNDPVISQLIGQVRGFLAAFTETESTPRESMRFLWRARDRLTNRVAYVLRSAFTPTATDWEAVTLPQWLFPLYYVLRPARLAVNALIKKRPSPRGLG